MERADLCPGCGVAVAERAEGCLALYGERTGTTFGGSAHIGLGRMAWDTYCVQHPDQYCVSVKSLIAHLGGLCWALEYGGHPSGYQALNRLLNGTLAIPKPQLPTSRGALTVADLSGIDDDMHAASIERWANAMWQAYHTLHPFARQWVETALARR